MPRTSLAMLSGYALRRWGLVLLTLAMAVPVCAQNLPHVTRKDLPNVYREARFKKQFDKILSTAEMRMTPLPPDHIASPADTVGLWIARQAFNYVPPKKEVKFTARVSSWQVIKRIERHTYKRQFSKVKWAYLGNNYFSPLDTVRTMEIRARMQSRFGPPTRTLVELDYSRRLRREEYIQFEYWFILNDSIPMIVMDVNGPFERGIVVACDHRYRRILFNMRQSFLGRMMRQEKLAPYVDYYYNYASRRWYRTGYDGQQFFTDPIGQPNLARGRPQLARPGG